VQLDVVLSSRACRRRSTLYRVGTSDPSGKFHFVWEDADFIRPVEMRGTGEGPLRQDQS
jgi:hypothetical protein